MMNIEALKLAIARFAKHDLSAFPTAERRDILGALSGYLVAMHTSLPTSPVSELVNYYVSTHEAVTVRIFDQINEVHFINPKIAAETARNVYLLRYNIVYEPTTMIMLSPLLFNGTAASLPAGVGKWFDKITPEGLAKINEYYF